MNFCELQTQGVNLALTTLRGSGGVSSVMPFIEDDMFASWSPANDARITADFSCIQVRRQNFSHYFQLDFNPYRLSQDLPDSNSMNQQSQQHQVHHITTQQQQPHTTQQSSNSQDLVNSCDLANLESLTCNDSDELLRQLTENTFELESFFSEFPTAEIKVVSARRKFDIQLSLQSNWNIQSFRRKTTTTWSTQQILRTTLWTATMWMWKPTWRFCRIVCSRRPPTRSSASILYEVSAPSLFSLLILHGARWKSSSQNRKVKNLR